MRRGALLIPVDVAPHLPSKTPALSDESMGARVIEEAGALPSYHRTFVSGFNATATHVLASMRQALFEPRQHKHGLGHRVSRVAPAVLQIRHE